jgi:translocator protein
MSPSDVGSPSPERRSFPSDTTEVQPRALVIAIVTCLAFALLGGLVGGEPPNGWAAELQTPEAAPPAILFLLVGALYYLIFGFVLYRIQVHVPERDARRWLLGLTLVVLAVGEIWNAVFVGLRSPGAGFAGMLLFFALLLALWVRLLSRERTSSWILAPYVVWSVYDLFWSFQIWRLNP